MTKHKNGILDNLQKVSEEGVLLYKKEKLVSPREIMECSRVCEDMLYELEFIVVDEAGQLKEIWFGDGRKKP